MLVVAIVAILAGLALPNMTDIVRGYRSRENAVEVLAALREARSVSQARNEPVRLQLQGSVLAIETPTYMAGFTAQDLVKVVDPALWSNLKNMRTEGVTFDAATNTVLTTGLYFCPSSRGTYRATSLTGPLLCQLGDLASQTVTLRYTVLGKPYIIELYAAVGNARFQGGS